MELSGAEVKKLRLALKDAFQESELQRFLREELDLRWSEDIEGGTYDAKISSLITLVESRGVLVFQKLVIGIAGERSKSLKIKEFVKIKIADLIEHDLDILSSDALICLINILEKIVDFNKIWIIGKAILPNSIEYHCSYKIEYLENSELSNWFRCFILLKLLSEDYPVLSDRSSIIVFIHKLLQEKFLTSQNKLELETWLQEVDSSSIFQSIQEPVRVREQSIDGELKAHLMITVNDEQSKFRVIASLLCIDPTGETKRVSVNLNPDSPERGVLCTKKQLSKNLTAFIQICLDSLQNSSNLLRCKHYSLIIELFLPIKLLCEPIDREKIFGDGVHFAAKYPLVIRSYDRFSKSVIQGKDLWNEFSRSLEQSRQILQRNPEANLQELIQSVSDVNIVKSMAFQETLRNSMGVKSNCSLPACQKQMYQFLLAILASGIPIIFLPRNNEPSPSEVIGEMEEEFLQIDLLRDRYKLLETVRSKRAYALDHIGTPEKRWLRHLTLIWDDPERMPLMNPLQTGGAKAS